MRSGGTAMTCFLTDCNIPGVDALRASEEARKINPDMAVVIMTSFGTIETAVKAIKAGAYDYLPKPIDLDQLVVLIERVSERRDLIRENTELKEMLIERYKFDEMRKHEPCHGGGPESGRPCGRQQRDGIASGRKRHREGAVRPRHPLRQPPRTTR